MSFILVPDAGWEGTGEDGGIETGGTGDALPGMPPIDLNRPLNLIAPNMEATDHPTFMWTPLPGAGSATA